MRHKHAIIILDLEPDHAGLTKESYDGWNENTIRGVFRILNRYHVPLSVFVVGKSIKKHKKIILYIKNHRAEFHLHSYSHDNRNADSEYEIIAGKREFVRHLDTFPIGYRAPQGLITKNGYMLLKKHGFIFDASVFPSFWPNIRYFVLPTKKYITASGIIEIPNTVLSPLRIIFSLSWIKLLGWPIFCLFIKYFSLPETVVFSFHLHDLIPLPAQTRLPLFWKFIYSRNKASGLHLLDNVITVLNNNGYTFLPVSSEV